MCVYVYTHTHTYIYISIGIALGHVPVCYGKIKFKIRNVLELLISFEISISFIICP